MSLIREQALERLKNTTLADTVRLSLTNPDFSLLPELTTEQRITIAHRLAPAVDEVQILQRFALERGGTLALEVANLYPETLRKETITDSAIAVLFLTNREPVQIVALGAQLAHLTDIHGFDSAPENITAIISSGEERTKILRQALELSPHEDTLALLLGEQRRIVIRELDAAGITDEKTITVSDPDQIIKDRVPPSDWNEERLVNNFEHLTAPIGKIQKLLDSWPPQKIREFAIGLLAKIDPETKTDIAIGLKKDIANPQPDWQTVIPGFCQALGISSLEFLLITSFLRKNPIYKADNRLYQRIIDESNQLKLLGNDQITRLAHLFMRDACTQLHVVPNNNNQELITAVTTTTQQGISDIIMGSVYNASRYAKLKAEAPALLKSGQEKINDGRNALNKSKPALDRKILTFVPFLDLAKI